MKRPQSLHGLPPLGTVKRSRGNEPDVVGVVGEVSGSFVHHGPWDERSRSNPTLNFIEKYQTVIDSLRLHDVPFGNFFSSFSTYHDTKGSVHFTGPQIWYWLQQQFSPFERVRHDVVEMRVVREDEGRDVVYGECLTHFTLKGDVHEIVAPRFFVWTIGEADRERGEGTDGKVIVSCRVFWDTGVIGRYVTERKREREMSEMVQRQREEVERERALLAQERSSRREDDGSSRVALKVEMR
ncbi:hypothetical protein BJ875DRAFT_17877 [Amylocarpus encephaloides]|uniref:Uncharacterized protein n=1 Tax=Amylocarpus encephaloides TaxID=45428 RepID=A0A9P8C583_9HELO|nr:hypothetical protein BJ875DRAFT_17877 [Amylocarpus encephaloides]